MTNQTDRLEKLWQRQSVFSQATFGADSERGPIGAIRHLKLEAAELEDKPDDVMEYADCVILVFDAFRRSGGTLEQLVDAIEKKLNINERRKWGKVIGNEPCLHVEEPNDP